MLVFILTSIIIALVFAALNAEATTTEVFTLALLFAILNELENIKVWLRDHGKV